MGTARPIAAQCAILQPERICRGRRHAGPEGRSGNSFLYTHLFGAGRDIAYVTAKPSTDETLGLEPSAFLSLHGHRDGIATAQA